MISTEFDGMMREADLLIKIAENIVVKLPTTVDGLRGCKKLSDQGIKTNMTLVFQPLQALMVAKAGAFLVSPFIGRLDDVAEDGTLLIHQIRQIYDTYGFTTKLLAASIRHNKHMVDCARRQRRCHRADERHQGDAQPPAHRQRLEEVR